RLLGELVADIVGLARHLAAKCDHRLAQLLVVGMAQRERHLLGAGAADRGRHQGLFDAGAGAHGTGNDAVRLLLVIGGRIAEPGLEFVIVVTDERVADHDIVLTGSDAPSLSTLSENCREFASEGTLLRASFTAARSSSPTMTPTLSELTAATMRPQGSTIME